MPHLPRSVNQNPNCNHLQPRVWDAGGRLRNYLRCWSCVAPSLVVFANKRAFIKKMHFMLHLLVVRPLKILGERIVRDFRWRLRSRLRPLLTWRVVFQYAPDSRSWNSKRFCVLSGQSREPTRTWCDERGNLNNDNIQTKQKKTIKLKSRSHIGNIIE